MTIPDPANVGDSGHVTDHNLIVAELERLADEVDSGSALATHAADTTDVHGITDTSVLATDADIATHAADTTDVHGIADTSVLATDAEVASAVSTHAADTTDVHGIADTSVLATDAEVASAVAAHAAAGDPHADYITEAEGSAAYVAKATKTFARAHSAAGGTASSSYTPVPLGTELFDTGGYHSTVTNTSRMTISETGYYRLTGQVMFGTSSALLIAMLARNGSTADRLGISSDTGMTGLAPRIQVDSGVYALTAGDYVELMAYSSDSATAFTGDSHTWLSIERVA